MSAVVWERRGEIAVVSLNRPDRLNAINAPLLDDLHACLSAAREDVAVRVIVLRGEGRAFCAGDDLRELAERDLDRRAAVEFVERLQDITRLIMFAAQPVVCAVQGYVVGGGAAWPLNADFTVFADDAVMFLPEARHGLFASGGATLLLAQRCGPERAKRLLHFGERADAAQLLADRIAGELAPRDMLDARALALAEKLCALPAPSLGRLKAAHADGVRAALEEALAREAHHCVEASLDAAARERAAHALTARAVS